MKVKIKKSYNIFLVLIIIVLPSRVNAVGHFFHTSPNINMLHYASAFENMQKYSEISGVHCFLEDTGVRYKTNPCLILNGGSDTLISGCGDSTAIISYIASGGGEISWNIISGPGTYTYPVIPTLPVVVTSSPVTIHGLTTSGDYQIRFYRTPAIGSGSLTEISDIVVRVSIPASSCNAGPAQYLGCSQTSTNMNATIPPFGTGTWSRVSGPNVAIINDIHNAQTLVSGLIPGIYRFRWTVTGNNQCPPNQSTTVIRVADSIAFTANAGENQIICMGNSISLHATPLEYNQTGLWTVTPSAGVIFSDVTISNPIVTGLSVNTSYAFYWTVTNTCNTKSDSCIISVLNPVIVFAGHDSTICNNEIYYLSEAIMQQAASLHWTTTGTGTFNNSCILNPVYTPGSADILEGFVYLTLTGFATCPCSAISDVIKLRIVPQ